jgi:hypothetical protein
MPRLSETFPSKTLSAIDIPDEGAIFTITGVVELQFEDGPKFRISLKETEKSFIANLTNSRTIGGLYGDDTDDWVGRRISIYATEVQYGSKMVPAIRVRSKAPKPPVKPPAGRPTTNKTTPPMTQEEADMGDDGWEYDRE